MTDPLLAASIFADWFVEAVSVALLEQACPRLPQTNYRVNSPCTISYNCIAWAAGDMARPWWPPEHPMLQSFYYWPPGVPTAEHVDSFKQMYQTVGGYETCGDGSVEDGFEKIAIYARGGAPTHAALQLPNGSWTSKCGGLFDIEHQSPHDVGGGAYGEVVVYMRRPCARAVLLG
jgi:hypothetical protein